MCIIQLFCDIHDFILKYEKQKTSQSSEDINTFIKRNRVCRLHISEVMTILVFFHQSNHRTFKHYYQQKVQQELGWAFPHLVSYTRFVELMDGALELLQMYLTTRYAACSGIAFADATALPVCHNLRISRHRVFAHNAARGMTSVGWFYGFKCHIIINDKGELLATQLTPANIDDRKPMLELTRNLTGKIYADRGYISQTLGDALQTRNLCLITKVRKNMKQKQMSDFDEALLNKRMLVETVIGLLKSQTQIQHTRHRSWTNYQVNQVAALIAYTHLKKKPAIDVATLREKYK